jgi:hypothetical protein
MIFDRLKVWIARALLYLKPYKKFRGRFEHSFLGIDKDEPDERDYVASFADPDPDITSYKLPINPYKYVKNQGRIGCCGSKTMGAAIFAAHEINATNRAGIPLSSLDHYFHARVLEKTYPEDKGMTSRAMLRVAQDRGIAPDRLWPYVIDRFNDKPDAFADMFAGLFKVKHYYRILTIEDAELALKNNLPILVGVKCNKSFLVRTGEITVNDDEDLFGGHEFFIYGFDSEKEIFYGINWWTTRYKKRGTMEVPYEYVRRYLMDLWTITV